MLVELLCSTRDMYQYRIHVIQINITKFKRNATSTHLRTFCLPSCVFSDSRLSFYEFITYSQFFLVKWWKTPCKYKKGFMAHSWLSHVLRCVCKCMNIFGAERPVLDISDIETLTLPTLQFWRGWRHQRLHPVTSRRRHPYARWYGGLHFILGWTLSLSYGHIPLLFKILLRKKKSLYWSRCGSHKYSTNF